MNTVATSSNSSLLKRARSTSDESDVDLVKKPRYFYILQPETTDYSSDGSESIYSIQARTTDTAKDTSDTSTKSEDSMVEFEIVSNSEDPVYPFSLRDSSSPPKDIPSGAVTFEFDECSNAFSDIDDCDNTSFSSEKEREKKKLYLFKTCVQCGQSNSSPLYRYCEKCFKVRKNFFPPRPRGRKRKTQNKASNRNTSNDSGINTEFSHGPSQDAPEERVDPEEQNVHRKELCGICLVRPKDGGYVHKNIVHVYSCYRCAVKTVKQIGRCPICNLRVRQVSKIIII